jgi:hypothetical protein
MACRLPFACRLPACRYDFRLPLCGTLCAVFMALASAKNKALGRDNGEPM